MTYLDWQLEKVKNCQAQVIQLHGTIEKLRCDVGSNIYPFASQYFDIFKQGEVPYCPGCAKHERYRQKFSEELIWSISFSNQTKLHNYLRMIRDENHFANNFFAAAQCYTNMLELQKVKEANGKSSSYQDLDNPNQNLILLDNLCQLLDSELTNSIDSISMDSILIDQKHEEINLNLNQTSKEDQSIPPITNQNQHQAIYFCHNDDCNNNNQTKNIIWHLGAFNEKLLSILENRYFEFVRKSNIYQTTEKAYEELKIENEALLKNLKDLEINHKKTKKELETSTKENTNLDKKLTLKKREFETTNKENANLDKKLTLKKQELETTNKENANLDKKISIKEQELEAAKKKMQTLTKTYT
ncbi:19780_t:CDS:2 [Gigaspora margarita]|uniref:19780_t:CDS:1 n=1 Tax=Gigaspora margarita TaxID=4874 RepID=A0ABM8VYH4_GIGMA|nr:19780_t:CDS:2 [Gigaspora margarita]